MITVRPILLESSNIAASVVERLHELLNNFGSVTVSDLNDLVGKSSTFTDEKWGWINLDGIDLTVNIDSDQVVLTMPKPIADPDDVYSAQKLPRIADIATMDELIKAKAVELQKIYDDRTAGDKTFEGFLYEFTKTAIATMAVEMATEYFFGKKP